MACITRECWTEGCDYHDCKLPDPDIKDDDKCPKCGAKLDVEYDEEGDWLG